MNIQGKINKLIKAMSINGYIFLVNREQFFSEVTHKVCIVYKLFHLIPVKKYNVIYPEKKKDENKYENVKVELLSTFKQEEILLKLVEIYKGIGGADG